MSAEDALNAARTAGIDVELDGDDLVLEASSRPPPTLIDLLSHHKIEVVALLKSSKDSPFTMALIALSSTCPDHVDEQRWRQAIGDGQTFLAQWGAHAHALGWTADELFGLHAPGTKPRPSYCRLSRYDCTGLVWLLQGLPVVALTADTAAIENPSGSITVYRRYNKPGIGPLGDSLDDFR